MTSGPLGAKAPEQISGTPLGMELGGQEIGRDAEYFAVRYRLRGMSVRLDFCDTADQLPKVLHEYLRDGAEAEPVRITVEVDTDLSAQVAQQHTRERIAGLAKRHTRERIEEIAAECLSGRTPFRVALARLTRVTPDLPEFDRSDMLGELLDEMAVRDTIRQVKRGAHKILPARARAELLERAERRVQGAIDALAGGPPPVTGP
ncbi:hypothetical protein [Actinomadura nitritigenes]|uniref:hypothetical protein n=1 Tax=Actinomadura nitritigenes TaxID=134602 RepID=UPI003D90AC85